MHALRVAPWLLTALVLAWPGRTHGADSNDGDGGAASTFDPRVEQVRALLAGALDVAVDPSRLFDTPLTDESAVRVEAKRLRAVVRSEAPPALSPADAEAWRARLALDEARLAFYGLSPRERDALLALHAERQAAEVRVETEAQRRVREAALAEERAREVARLARSEAERLVAEEMTRVAALETAIATARLGFEASRKEIAARRDTVLGWQRRAREARATPETEAVDSTYDALRRALRSSRDDLERALDGLDDEQSALPLPWVDRLADVPSDVPTDLVRARRKLAWDALRDARREERALGEDRTAQLLEEINVLNRERLGLLDSLTQSKRDATTGFSLTALDQARAEARHLLLTLRSHWQVSRLWLVEARREGRVNGLTVWRFFAVLVPWVLATLAFIWLRRRSPALLSLSVARESRADRARRLSSPSAVSRALGFLRSVHGPLEVLVFFGVLLWLLPDGAQALLEVRLFSVIVSWSLVGALVVDAINHLAAGDRHPGNAASPLESLRLRSLRLVVRVVVGFGLALVLCARLVGEGTVYSWVLMACWLAAVPVFLVLVRWWRETVFERLERLHRKSRVQLWVLENRRGWKSFLAGMVGAVHLFAAGIVKTARKWVGGFEVARRAHAWLYKRELERLAEETPQARARPLDSSVSAQLSPERQSSGWVACPGDELLTALAKRVAARAGGVIALVGPRGAGKSSLLRRLQAQVAGAVDVRCSAATRSAHLAALAEVEPRPPLVLLDDAEAMMKPLQGGLAEFDQVLALARRSSQGSLWVFSVDDVLWPFLQRAREGRPMFDEVLRVEAWSDEEIGALLELRSAEAGIEPVFDDLLERLQAAGDEADRLEALRAHRAGYFRMTWDYARGNPAMALEAWRASLVESATGAVRVRPLVAPDTSRLEALPDSSLFVLRAVLQLTPADVGDLARATRLTSHEVQNAVSFGQTQGYFVAEHGLLRVASPWLRPVMVVLERRHLLVGR